MKLLFCILIFMIFSLLFLSIGASANYRISSITTPSNNIIIGTSTQNTYFNENGFMFASGNAQAWDDVFLLTIISAKSTGVGSLALTTITQNLKAYAFAVNDEVYGTSEFTHAWNPSTTISIHAHMINKGLEGTNKDVKFELEYCFMDFDGQPVTYATVSKNYTILANTPDNTHHYVEFGDIIPAVNRVSPHFICRLKRITATGTAPLADPIILTIGGHGLINSLGSRTEYIK